ncbi:acyl-CoA dehydrogenase family protein [Pseudonocardia sp. GCM10023141]|uniref:acyl-CoA dehydrogenase family protein n=1 Tax=Pseudonocardia sp. GCM10023141 TaxID=3252653 RepID=UPI0036200BDF
MDLSLSVEQEAVQGAFASFFEKESGINVVRAAEPLGFDQDLWDRLRPTGALIMGLPADVDGDDATALDLTLVCREAGRCLAPVPLAEFFAAGRLIAAAGAGPLLADVAAGRRLPTIAPNAVSGDVLSLVPAGAVADIVLALHEGVLVALVRHDDGATPQERLLPNLGDSPIADWDLARADRIVLAEGADAARHFAAGRADWQLFTAAALDGLRARALEIGVAYVKERKAFDVPIGWFQAIQHRLADVAVDGDGAELLVHEAAWARDTDRPEATKLASMAFLHGARTAFRTARESLQFHGGYGYTLEYDIQLYFRRAKAWPLALGDPRHEYRRLAELAYPA